ncbi:MAG: DAK2 domain-containing protein [Clostridiales bacterium]
MSNIEALTSAHLRNFFSMGEAMLNKHKEEVNALNVFPVPDGDTGTNMGLTLVSAVKNLEEGMSIKEICASVSRGALMGARGNSGVITSQILRGMTMAMQSLETVDAQAFAKALEKGVEIAYKSVLKPVEGTILTVSRLTAEAALAKAEEKGDVVELLSYAIEAGKIALNNTPNQLPVLRDAGVVDAGGRGFILFLEGGLLALEGKTIESLPRNIQNTPDKAMAFSAEFQECDITYRYCTELMIHKAKKDHEFVRHELEKLDGDSLVCVGDEGIIKIHFHTNDPGRIISFALTIGELYDIKIENMKEQMAREAAEKHMLTKDAPPKGPKKTCGIVAIASGDGMAEIFKSLGVDEVISGGQTMNPSAEDILNAMESVNADEIVILPNNSNIILAAEQAVKMSNQPVALVPTKYITQGVSVLLQYNSEAGAKDNAELMMESLDSVANGEVTFAIRDSKINGVEIKADDMLGILNGEIVTSEPDLTTAVLQLVEQMEKEESSLLTLYYGNNITEEKAEELAEIIGEKYEDWDIEVYKGGQALYYYLISLE